MSIIHYAQVQQVQVLTLHRLQIRGNMIKIKKSNEIWWKICEWNCNNNYSVEMEDGEKWFTATPCTPKSQFLFALTFSEHIL